MLRRLKTKNFRKLTDTDISFASGLQVVRGANEAGKSSLLEALAYALFGIKACRQPLDEVVTWGKPVGSLKVELIFEFDGVTYTATRSKAGAEINYKDGKVTGQTETKAFIERLLGVNADTVSRLMLASQGSIRGALEQGSATTMQLIEKLANFDLLDLVIDLIQTKLTTGNTGALEEKVKTLATQADALKAELAEPDLDAFDRKVAEYEAIAASTKLRIEAELLPALHKAEHTYRELAEKRGALSVLVSALQHQQQRIDSDNAALRAANAALQGRPAEGAIEALRQRITAAQTLTERLTAWTRVTELMNGYPDAFWEGDAASLQDEITASGKRIAEQQATIAGLEGQVRVFTGQQKGSTSCSTCGQELPNAEAMRKHNDEIKAKVEALSEQLPLLRTKLIEARQEHAALTAVQQAATPFDRVAQQYGQYVSVECEFVPPKLTWKGETPTAEAAEDVKTLTQKLTALERQNTEAEAAAMQVDRLTLVLAQAAADLQQQKELIAKSEEAVKDLPAVEAQVSAGRAQVETAQQQLQEALGLADVVRVNKRAAVELYAQQQHNVEAAQMTYEEAVEELKVLEFNNALLKRVRQARPIIADKLWTVVLAAVSNYFSSMRGMSSVVTREANGFRVDGQGVEGLSGSTLDILGLAIRMALTRTFLPNSPFLVLDEPAAACDSEREAAMIGFVQAAGFPQTLLVTHSDLSESAADDLIIL